MSEDYSAFLARKALTDPPTGLADIPELPAALFPHQRDIVRWALRRGRAAIFAQTGLGKSLMELAWGHGIHRATGGDVLLLTPLAVAGQMVREAGKFGLAAKQCACQAEVEPGITVTNYAKLHHFDLSCFTGVILDESSILKAFDGKTRSMLIDLCARVPYRLAATATPAPNDFMELGNHAEFLGVMSLSGMQATFFTHDGGDTSKWRLKGYAEDDFWRWMCSWSVLLRRPSDLGYDDGAYALPELGTLEHLVDVEGPAAKTLSERLKARRESIAERVAKAVEIIAIEGVLYGVETGVCGEPEAARSCESGTQGEAPCFRTGEPRAQSGRAEGVHEGLLREEAGEISPAHAGAASRAQREAPREVRGGCGLSESHEGEGEGLAGEQSAYAEGAALTQVQPDAAGVSSDAGIAGREMPDLRVLGHEQPEALSVCGSLPHDGESARPALLELQSRAWALQRQRGSAAGGNSVPVRPWLIWCNLNSEQDALERLLGDLAFSVRGADSEHEKTEKLAGWIALERPVMISKASIIGFGMNFQFCADTIFVGLNDSFEQVYQAVRRFWRFGQTRPVTVHFVAASTEGAVLENLKRKEADAERMGAAMVAQMADLSSDIIHGAARATDEYKPTIPVAVPFWLAPEDTLC